MVLQFLLITLVVAGMSSGQVNFSPYWNQGKRSGGTLTITPEECKSSMDSLIYLYKLIQVRNRNNIPSYPVVPIMFDYLILFLIFSIFIFRAKHRRWWTAKSCQRKSVFHKSPL